MTIRNKELFRLNIILGIVLLILILLFSLGFSAWFSIGFVFVSIIWGKSKGVEFDFKNRKYRKYSQLFIWKTGDWKEITDKIDLVILVKHGVKSTSGTMLTSSLKIKGGFSELYFMDESHTQRFYIASSENHEYIESLADDLSSRLMIPIAAYKPRTYSI
ncbi:hypothetical protein [Brumimicrobium oceani]|uniref:Uncharacterized protein n=1 Tax=Brumimicrobium oceani TaxID=2100725 RepID=A0A2U2XBB0_9FLAO|nr:hypothetical protein [Brumimicrobium oceani]PWH85084.1 hypothetical protein DIT68_10625 [Brumimicrobium oceani]